MKQIYARHADPLSVSTSYVIMRNGIGALGLALPIVLIVGGGLNQVQESLSAYYHFAPGRSAEYGAGRMRDVFVGFLCAIGAFLFFYRGHSFQEDMALNIAGISVVVVALVPMDWPSHRGTRETAAAIVHSVAAFVFFIMIAYVCIFRARDTLLIMKDHARRKRFGRLYLLFGILMLATPFSVVAIELAIPANRIGYSTLIIEVSGVLVFSTFWLVKGYEIRAALRPVPRTGAGRLATHRAST